jgi:hypothetical protein
MKAFPVSRQILLASFLAAASACAAPAPDEGAVVLKGKRVRLDDALFTGCFHDAFEGIVEKNADGTPKRGEQEICHTKGVLFGADSAHSQMAVGFTLDRAPSGKASLVIRGIQDSLEPPNRLEVKLNGKALELKDAFNANDVSATGNARYYIGWKDLRVELPAGALAAGANRLSIANLTSVLDSGRWNFCAVDHVELECPEDVEVRVERPAWPIYYFGLDQGLEVNLWPSVNRQNRLCLVVGMDVECNFYVTLPKELAPVKGAPGKVVETPELHLVTDADVRLAPVEGGEAKKTAEGGLAHWTIPLGRLVRHSTPHPAQGVRVFLSSDKPFQGKTLTAWATLRDARFQKRTFALDAVELKGDAPSVEGFELGLWGGGIPKEAEARRAWVAGLRRAGFRRVFTGDDEALNLELQATGFAVYPRFGWFGGQFRVGPDKESLAAVDEKGNASKKDFCPLEILKNADDPQLGKHFQTAAKFAEGKGIAGLCVDYETAAAWCWCPRCMALFEKETGLKPSGRADLAAGGKHEAEYRDFGRRRNRDLLRKVSEVMKAKNPALKYCALASASDLPGYWWDGRSGRHAARYLAEFVDEMMASLYCYEMPGGLKSVPAIIRTAKRYAFDQGRDVGVGVLSPIATTVSESPRYRGVTLSPESTRLLVVLTAVAGGRGVSLFRGDCFDGRHYLATRRAMEEVAALQPFLRANLDRSAEVVATPSGEEKPRYDLDASPNFISRITWRPDLAYQYDAFQLLKDPSARERLLALFNYAGFPLRLRVKLLGLANGRYEVSEWPGGKKLGEFARPEMESGKAAWEVPARDARFLLVREVGKAAPEAGEP